MELKAKTINTPVGKFKAPLNPHFTEILKNCETDEDLFELVKPNGHINPDALNEVEARGIYPYYWKWVNEKLVSKKT